MTEPWFDRRTWVRFWLTVLVLLGAVVTAYVVFGRADVQVDGPVVRRETAWIIGTTGGMDGQISGQLELVDGCVLLDGTPVVWPESVGWDGDQELVLIDGDPVPWGSVVTGSGGETDFTAAARRWDDRDVTREAAPCYYEAGSVHQFNADSELEVTPAE